MRILWFGLLAMGAAIGAATIGLTQRAVQQPGLTSFQTEGELRRFLKQLAGDQGRGGQGVMLPMAAPPPPPPPPPPALGAADSAPSVSAPQSITVTGAKAGADGITNTQVAGVDEGGIVKQAGDIMVVLRRGRLFTVSLANGGMRPVAAIDAYPPGADGSGSWYDEMLISGDRVVVIGYSYGRGGTEVNRFRLGRDGAIRFEDSTQLKSNDYYSSSNYASRLIGTTLIYYTPLYLEWEDDPLEALPALRRWQPGGREGQWRRIASPRRVFVPQRLRTARAVNLDTLHSVTTCDLAAPSVDCRSTAVLGSDSRSFFVSRNAIYVWTSEVELERGEDSGYLYRLPFDGRSRPQAVRVRGTPIDQFSFSPDAGRGALNVMVRSDGGGDAMWRSEWPDGALALIRIPMNTFGTGAFEVPRQHYQRLPEVRGWSIQNRFVGDHLLYGAGQDRRVTVVGVGDRKVTQVPLPHSVSRLDLMGADAIVVGDGRGGLNFSTVALTPAPRATDTFLLPSAREGETRSHAFFFRADSPDGRRGLLGLPVARARSEGTRFLGNSAAIQYLARNNGRLADAGELEASGVAGRDEDDGCVASCVDWYGNARPIFWNGRVFALMGYELVEGREQGGRIRESARIGFSPPLKPRR